MARFITYCAVLTAILITTAVRAYAPGAEGYYATEYTAQAGAIPQSVAGTPGTQYSIHYPTSAVGTQDDNTEIYADTGAAEQSVIQVVTARRAMVYEYPQNAFNGVNYGGYVSDGYYIGYVSQDAAQGKIRANKRNAADADIENLAKMVYGEARCLPADEQKLAVWCALNRVDAGYGDTITAVVTAPNQFNGYRRDNPVTDEIYAVCAQAVAEWLAGNEPPVCEVYAPTQNYLYFDYGKGQDGMNHNYYREYWR